MDGHLTWGIGPDALRAARAQLAEGARAAGRDPLAVPSKAIVPTALLRRGESVASPRVLQSLAPFITNFLHVQVEWDETLLPVPPHLREPIARYRKYAASLPVETRHLTLHEGHLVYARDDEREFLLPEIAEAVALVGEPDQVIERIRALEAAGLSHFAFQVTDDPVGQLHAFASEVIRRYRA